MLALPSGIDLLQQPPQLPSEPGRGRFAASGHGGMGGESGRLLHILRRRAQPAEHGCQLLDRGLQLRKRHSTGNFVVIDGPLLRGGRAHCCLERLDGCAHCGFERLSNLRQSADSIEQGEMSLLEGCDQPLRKSSRQFADSVVRRRMVATRLEQRHDTAQKADLFGLDG